MSRSSVPETGQKKSSLAFSDVPAASSAAADAAATDATPTPAGGGGTDSVDAGPSRSEKSPESPLSLSILDKEAPTDADMAVHDCEKKIAELTAHLASLVTKKIFIYLYLSLSIYIYTIFSLSETSCK